MLRRSIALCLALFAFAASVQASSLHNVQIFGGYGQDGTKSVSGTVTETQARTWNYESYSVQSSAIHNVLSGSVINALQPVSISGTISVGAGGAGGPGNSGGTRSINGKGPGGGPGGNASDHTGGYGGACAGSGGFGSGGQTAPDNPAVSIAPGLIGSGGAGGGTDGGTVGNGGAGGGRLILTSASGITLNSSGTISAPGASGTSATYPGGGGSGGVVGVFSLSFIICSSGSLINVSGGNGATGSTGGGGGGGGGLVYLMAPSVTTAGTINVAGGTGGGGSPVGAHSGGAGSVITVIGTPSLPLMVWMMNHPVEMRALARAHSNLTTTDIAHAAERSHLAPSNHERVAIGKPEAVKCAG